MKKFSLKTIPFIPASHEDQTDPGCLKAVLVKKGEIHKDSNLQMINWAILKKGRRFEPHFHEDMDEVFIILSGKVEIKVGREVDILEKGEGVVVSMRSIHMMKNLSDEDVEYLAMAFTLGKNGMTVNVEEIA